MKSIPTKKQNIGALGEAITAKYLRNKGFTIVEMNYRKKFGEIDVIARKGQKIYFVEVKTVSRENLKESLSQTGDSFRPEDNVHSAKLKRLTRTISVYLAEKGLNEESDWQFDVITVLLDEKAKIAKVESLENIIL